jgi:hypothetical protein
LSGSAARAPSVSAGRPPAASICIISEVPERGRPETRTGEWSSSALIGAAALGRAGGVSRFE